MSQIADITVYDGAGTPVSHVLKAKSVTKEKGVIVCEWQEQLASLPNEAQVSAVSRSQKLASGVVRTHWVVNVPVMESVSGQNSSGYTAAPKVAYIDRNEWINYAHPRSTITGRRTARMLLANIANNVSTSVAAATTGPFAESVDNGVMPT